MSPAPSGPGRRRLVVLRHGETTHNAAGIWQGQLDSPLSELGLEQADAVGAAVAALSPDRIVTSDLARARVTAESVGRATGIRVELDPRFREIHAGRWQGLTAEEVARALAGGAGRGAARRGRPAWGRRGVDARRRSSAWARASTHCWPTCRAGACAVVSTHGAAGPRGGRAGCSASTSRSPGGCSPGSATATGQSCTKDAPDGGSRPGTPRREWPREPGLAP